jgi:hypothetical protein
LKEKEKEANKEKENEKNNKLVREEIIVKEKKQE